MKSQEELPEESKPEKSQLEVSPSYVTPAISIDFYVPMVSHKNPVKVEDAWPGKITILLDTQMETKVLISVKTPEKDSRGKQRTVLLSGGARCNPLDRYDEGIGAKIAARRACHVGSDELEYMTKAEKFFLRRVWGSVRSALAAAYETSNSVNLFSETGGRDVHVDGIFGSVVRRAWIERNG